MRFSKLFTKTIKNSREYSSKNATLLIKAGFIDQLMSGVYTFLPLGLRVLNKIENIIREEMDKVSNEILMPAISPVKNWETTNRLESIDVLLKVSGANKASKLRNSAEYILNPTHEDIVTPLVQKYNMSYKDFPFSVYQIQNKFRNEPRAKSGLLRGREFRMKDAYSFHTSETSLNEYYEIMKSVYMKIYERLGLGEKTVIALASGGDFTKDFSHEFQTFCDAGEDLVFYDEKLKVYYNREVTPSKAPAPKYISEKEEELEEFFGEEIIGVKDLSKALNVEVSRITKTILFKSESGFIAAAVRGDYEIDEGKLKKVLNVETLRLATPDEVKRETGTVVGYVGLLNLNSDIQIIVDESCDNRLNFEMGANKENYHIINVNWGRDIQRPDKFYDIKVAKVGDLNPALGKPYKTFKVAEVGNIFPLNTKFSDAFDYKFTDENGKERQVYMGSYGIGSSRVMGVIAEIFNDDFGIIWPDSIAPFKVHLISIGRKGEESINIASNLYNKLQSQGIEVLWDDRDINPGEKFKDADLIGNPIRIVVSKKSLDAGGIEVKLRDESDSQIIKVDQIINFLKD